MTSTDERPLIYLRLFELRTVIHRLNPQNLSLSLGLASLSFSSYTTCAVTVTIPPTFTVSATNRPATPSRGRTPTRESMRQRPPRLMLNSLPSS